MLQNMHVLFHFFNFFMLSSAALFEHFQVQISDYSYVNLRKVCYNHVGCFDTEAPFFSLPDRPVPPPQDPNLLKPYVRYIVSGNPNEYWEIPLTGELNLTRIRHLLYQEESTIFVIGCFNDDDANDDDGLMMKLGKSLEKGILRKPSVFVFGHHVKAESDLQGISNLRTLGGTLARFIKHLQVFYNVKTNEQVWLVSTGCGCHMAGYVGSLTVINRITALDPSSYLFEGESTNVRLDRSDALFVDVIHTDSRPSIKYSHGYMQPIGHVDFYVNGGFRQPGCSVKDAGENSVTSRWSNVLSPKYIIANQCNHHTAVDYFNKTLPRYANCMFWGHDVTMEDFIRAQSNSEKSGGIRQNFILLRQQCNQTSCVPMGFHANNTLRRGIKVVTTNGMECSLADQEKEDGWLDDFVKDQTNNWLHSLFPLDKYVNNLVPILPPIVNTSCYHNNYLGCFNMTPPWTVVKSRPVPPPETTYLQSIEIWFFTRQENLKQVKHRVRVYSGMPTNQHLPFDSTKMTFAIIHGFYNHGDEPWIVDLKDALLNASDANVFVFNWGSGAVTMDYLQALGNLRLASRAFSNLLQFFIDHRSLNVTHLHLIGHSLGAHIAGLIGKSIPGIFQITALDPAQPWFQGADLRIKLTKNDANFVVVLHSDAAPFLPDVGFGIMEEIGHVDFYLNGGFKQLTCNLPHATVAMMAPKFTNIFDMMKPVSQVFVRIVLCPHQSAVEIFIAAIRGKEFY